MDQGSNAAETERDSDKYTYKEMARGRGEQDGGIEMENGRSRALDVLVQRLPAAGLG